MLIIWVAHYFINLYEEVDMLAGQWVSYGKKHSNHLSNIFRIKDISQSMLINRVAHYCNEIYEDMYMSSNGEGMAKNRVIPWETISETMGQILTKTGESLGKHFQKKGFSKYM